MTRSENSAKNALMGIIAQFISILTNLILRKVFIATLGTQYLGISGLFTNVISILNIAELGLGAAITFEMYKPLAKGDHESLKSLFQLYKKLYRIIGFVVLLLCLSLMPFLKYIIKGYNAPINIYLIYSVYIFQTVSSYWFWAYKNTILSADQKDFKTAKLTYAFTLGIAILQIVAMITLKETNAYMAYIIIPVFCTIMKNFLIARMVNKNYPYITEKEYTPVEKSVKKNISKNVLALSTYKISGTVLSSTDNIIISAFLSVQTVGLYSNYLVIITAINSMLGKIFGAFTPSIGNLQASGDKERTYFVFKGINFLNFWLFGVCAVCIFVLINPFIEIFWLGSEYTFNLTTVIIIVLNFITPGLQNAVISFKDACGLFWYGKLRPICSAALNVIISIVLVKRIGLDGVILGTIISRFLTTWWFDPCMIHKYAFGKKPWGYFLRYIRSLIIITLVAAFMYWIKILLSPLNFITFFALAILCLIVPNVVFWLLFRKSDEYKYVKSRIENIINKRRCKKGDILND